MVKKLTLKVLAEASDMDVETLKMAMWVAYVESNANVRERLYKMGYKQYDY